MRRDYLVTYDISDPKRLRLVYRVMLAFGDHIQLSVFRCALSASELQGLKERLHKAISHTEDQVLFVELGPLPERAPRIEPLGRAYGRVAGSRVL